ncbi:AraC family transcriptional regulator [Flavihumibacter solisilvae]|nr:AraC family transcriptional regulator [Flavihumibacter solisilvae]
MKPVFAKILEDIENQVFCTRITDGPYFATEFHFHKECQINYVLESEGKRIIGDSVGHFTSDELTLLGSDLPHVWYNDRDYAKSITLFFDPDRVLSILSQFGPACKFETLFKAAKRGIKYSGTTKTAISKLLLDIPGQEGITKIISLLNILEILTQAENVEFLASNGYTNSYHAKDNDRVDRVFKFVFSNFAGDIQLEEAAAIANMHKHAFCRYFKERTRRTFVQFVNEVRIGHACKLIAEGETNVSSLAYDCGYNSLSNFNKFFRKIKGMSPRNYMNELNG